MIVFDHIYPFPIRSEVERGLRITRHTVSHFGDALPGHGPRNHFVLDGSTCGRHLVNTVKPPLGQ